MGQSLSPTRSLPAASAENTGGVALNLGRVSEGSAGGEACETVAGGGGGASVMNVGPGVPVARRHSYTMGGKPRIPLSLGEFLRVATQPESEPPMF